MYHGKSTQDEHEAENQGHNMMEIEIFYFIAIITMFISRR